MAEPCACLLGWGHERMLILLGFGPYERKLLSSVHVKGNAGADILY